MPVELVIPTAIGSSSTQAYGTTMVAERRRPSVVGPSTVYGTIASSTVTVAIDRSSRCGLVTRIRISPGENSTRLTSNASGGGGFSPTRSSSDSPRAEKSETTATSRTIGTSTHRRRRRDSLRRGLCSAAECASTAALVGDLEEAHPAELRELGLVRVEHEVAGVGEVDLDDPALALAEHDRVRVLELVARAGRVIAEEVPVEVEGVDQVELGQVGQVDAHGLRAPDLDRIARVVERRAVDRVEVVLAVAVGVEGVHHHHQLLRGGPRLGRVDDEGAVEALVDVLLQRGRM